MLKIPEKRQRRIGGDEAIRQASPETVVIWITAHRTQETDEQARQLAVYRCLDKPAGVIQIRKIVREALEIAARPGWKTSASGRKTWLKSGSHSTNAANPFPTKAVG